MIEDFKKDINNSLNKIQENTGKPVEALKEETQKSLKELDGNTTKQVKELSKTHPGSKHKNRNNEEITKGDNTGDRTPRKEIRDMDARISNRIQEIEERISGAEDAIGNIDTTVKGNAKCKSS